MRYLKYAALVGFLVVFSGAMAKPADAHVRLSIGIGIGPAYVGPPVCAFGYYAYYPYACAPRGYYGPEWFARGVFIGAGPWFHGFYGPAFYGRRRFHFDDRGWRDFHDHDGWRNFRGESGRRDFRGDRSYHFRGEARRNREGFHRFRGNRDFHERGGARGRVRGRANSHSPGRFRGGRDHGRRR